MKASGQKLKRKYKLTASIGEKPPTALGETRFQLRLPHPALPGVYYETFSSREDAEAEKKKLLAKLDAGEYIPHVWLKVQSGKRLGLSKIKTHAVLEAYIAEHKTISESDKELARLAKAGVADVSISLVNYDFAEKSVHVMRTTRNWSPSSIQKRVGCLGRAWAWFAGKNPHLQLTNPWRLLPKGYSIASLDEQKQLLEEGKKIKLSGEVGRRFEDGDEEHIERVFNGEKLLQGRQRTLKPSPELRMMYRTILFTGLRLRECYTLRTNQIVLNKRVIKASGTKGERGAAKPRNVPIRKQLTQWLKEWIDQLPKGETRLFPTLWNGSSELQDLADTTNTLSHKFATFFEHALMPDFREHDLRHEATCRWVLLENESGNWVYSETMIEKIMGWSSSKMLKRYMSLRGEDLVELLGDL